MLNKETRLGGVGGARLKITALLMAGLLSAGAFAAAPASAEDLTSSESDVTTTRSVDDQAATDPGGDVNIASSRGFTITNLSGHKLRLSGSSGTFEGQPDKNSIIQPGFAQTFEVKYKFGYTYTAAAIYDVLDLNDNWVGSINLEMKVSTTSNDSSCTIHNGIQGAWGSCDAGGTSVTVRDTANTDVEVPAGQGQQQAAVLNNLCLGNSNVTCTFTPTKQETVYVDSHKIGVAYGNKTSMPVTKELTATQVVGQKHSVEVSGSAKGTIMKVVELSSTAKWNKEWNSSTTVTDKTTFQIPPGKKVWAEASFPMTRDTGDFTVSVGNTTWHLRGVYFDHPTSDTADQGEIDWVGADITPDTPSVSDMPTVVSDTYGEL